MNDLAKNFVLLVVVLFVLFSVFQSFGINGQPTAEVRYTAFLDDVRDGSVESVVFEEQKLWVTLRDESRENQFSYVVNNPETDNTLLIGLLGPAVVIVWVLLVASFVR